MKLLDENSAIDTTTFFQHTARALLPLLCAVEVNCRLARAKN
jgi:hypothetical protein